MSIDAAGKFVWGLDRSLNSLESGDVTFVVITTVTLCCSITWFFFTSLFYKRVTPEHKASIDALFLDMRTPIDHVAEHTENRDAVQYHIVGSLNLILGSALMLGVFIPNTFGERMVFIYCGGVVAAIGAVLRWIGKKKTAATE